jgi:ketosteroid isomerase-like protein
MTPDEDRITRLYDAFNNLDFDRCVAMMAADVVWPDEAEDRLLKGRDAVRAYFVELTSPLRAHHDVISLYTGSDGRVGVLSRQIINSTADGSEWSSTRVLHRYTLRDGLIARMEPQQDCPDTTFPGVDALLQRLHKAINARDIDAVIACYAPNARFADSLEGGQVEGVDGMRAHFEHLFNTVRVEIAVLDYVIQPDDRVRARLNVVARGPRGGLWQDGAITVWYRLERGLIVEQDVDDSGRDGNAL